MTAQTILPANTLSSGFDVANSLMFNDGDNDYLNKTPAGDGSRIKWTWSGWIKRCSLGHQPIFSTPGNSGNIYDEFYFNSTDKIQYSAVVSGTQYALRTARQFRDTNAWYHIVLIFDSNNGTAGDRMQLWVNGVRTVEADFEDTTFKDAQNYNSATNKASYVTYIGRVSTNTAAYFDGYMAEVVFQNDNADSPVDKFGEFDEDSPSIWKPIDVSGLTLGTNGFYLDFEDSSDLGNDAAGSNNWTANNVAATSQMIDTPTNNHPTMNFLNVPTSSGPTFSEGNLSSVSTNANFGGSSTFGMTTGKWYCEAKCVTDATIRNAIGITGETGELARDNNAPTSSSSDQSSIGYLAENGNFYNPAAGNQGSSYGDSYANDDIIGIAMDLDNMKLYFSKNGTFQNSGDPTTGATGTGAIDITVAVADTIDGAYFVCQGSAGASTSRFDWNFGSPPYAVSSGNSDGKGHGNFEYSVPSGYLAWCTKNLGSDGG